MDGLKDPFRQDVTKNAFNKLWAGQTISLLGSALTMFALPTLAVLVLHATPPQLGWLIALETLPFPILGMLVGVLADRYSRRKIMIVSDLLRFAALATIPLAAGLGVLRMPQLYAVALVTGIGSVFFGISYQSYLPVVVSADRLANANTKLEFSNSGSQMLGNALAGVLVQWVGAAAAIAVDAFSYLVSVATLSRIRAREPAHAGPPLSLSQGARELGEGLRAVFGSSDLRWILLTTATINLGNAMSGAVILIYAYRVLHLQPGLLGIVTGVANLGFVGALLSTKLRRRLGLRATLVGSILLAGTSEGCMLFAAAGMPYIVWFAASALIAIAHPIYNVNQVSYRQALVDVSIQGRVNATMRTFVWGTLPLGAIVGGYCGSLLGIPQTILAAAIISIAAAAWLLPLQERATAIG